MISKKPPRDDLDPLDKEILERALQASLSVLKTSVQCVEDESDKALEQALRIELLEIARFNGVRDPEALKDILLRTRSPISATGSPWLTSQSSECACGEVDGERE